jgi:hypothetical protein
MVKHTFDPFTIELVEDEDGRAKIIIADHPDGPSFLERLRLSFTPPGETIATQLFIIERRSGFLRVRVSDTTYKSAGEREWLRECATPYGD